MMKQPWVNIHTHKPGKGINIVDPCLNEESLPGGENIFLSRGIHPLFIDETAERRLKDIEQAAAERKIVAIGEAGLDRNSPVSIERQQQLFARQAEIAAHYELPLIIHGVRAIPEIITLHNKYRNPEKWILHGFNNRKEILKDLLRHGFYISAGRHVMNEQSNVFQLLPEIPMDKLLIETDNSDYRIEEIYQKVAERREMDPEVLLQCIFSNYNRLFKNQYLFGF